MKILLVGNGGRENAIAWKIFNSPSFQKNNSKLYNTKGSPGIDQFAHAIDIESTDIEGLVDFAVREKIDLTVCGPEIPLSMGIADRFEEKGLRIFGPRKNAAEIESSKVFSKSLMMDNGIPTAAYKNFSESNSDEAKEFLKSSNYPVVIKADGLAAGKGVIICENLNDATAAVDELCDGSSFGDAGRNFIIEEFLTGEEVSVFVITDGKDFAVLPHTRDHKKILEGEKGKNTGGMGAIAPVMKYMTADAEKMIRERVIEPVLKALRDQGREFKGCLYCGLMMVNGEPYVIEFNCRFGDPETQAVLPLIGSDFLELLFSSVNGNISGYDLKLNDEYACCVVLASDGYPGKFEKGKEIIFDDADSKDESSIVFHSGTKFSNEGKVITNGGRVISVVGLSEKNMEEAIRNAYSRADKIRFENKYFRKDIGVFQL